jgi:signal transduction histidine kinase
VKSLKYKIMLPVLLLSIIGVILMSFVGYYDAKHMIISREEQATKARTEKLTIKVEGKLKKWKMQVNMLSLQDDVKNMDKKKYFDFIKENKEVFNEFEVCFISDKQGNFYSNNGEEGGILDRDYFHEAMSGEVVISQPIISKSTNRPIIVIAAPVKNNNIIVGVVGVTINLELISDIINHEKVDNDGYAFMIGKDGVIIAHPNKEYIFKHNVLTDSNSKIREIGAKMINGEMNIDHYNYDGLEKIVYYKQVHSAGWSIAVTSNYASVIKSVIKVKIHLLTLGAMIVTGIALLLFFHISCLVKPINSLKKCMEIAIDGDLNVQSNIASDDEIGVLSHSFNALIKENKRLLEEAREYDKLKTEFFSNLSHELKTPLNIIFSSTQLMSLYCENDAINFDNSKLTKHINTTKQNCYRLLRLVNNLIDITRIDSGYLKLNLQNGNIIEVIEDITLSTVEYVESKGRIIEFDTDVEEKYMAFDSEKMERIILNLISNAVKFTTQKDKIEVKIYDKEESVLISVKDTGIGIPKEKQEIIFERFRQADSLYSRSHEGSGIGLALVKSLVEMHRGKISVISEIGEGAEFIIELPIDNIVEDTCENRETTKLVVHKDNVERIQIEFSDIYM